MGTYLDLISYKRDATLKDVTDRLLIYNANEFGQVLNAKPMHAFILHMELDISQYVSNIYFSRCIIRT